jgi:hypothetical protein
MATARRVYLYLIAFVALGMSISGLSGLAETGAIALVEVVAPGPALGPRDLRGQLSFSVALSVIGLIAWLAHWTIAERGLRRGGPAGLSERGAATRRLFLYAALLVGGLISLFSARSLARDLVRAMFGAIGRVEIIAGFVIEPAALLLVTGAFWIYYWRIAARDRALAAEVGASATLRRWFAYGITVASLLVLVVAAIGLISTIWTELARAPASAVGADRWLSNAVAGDIAGVAVGLATWILAWRWGGTFLLVRSGVDAEVDSVLRKVAFYLVLGVAVAWTVWNLGQIFYGLFRLALIGGADATGPRGIVVALGRPIANSLVFAVVWRFYARVVRHEAALHPEARRQAAIRWLYQYLVSLVSMVAFAFGLAGALATFLDLQIQPGAAHPTNWWQDRIALFTTLAAVGLPLWVLYWRPLQAEASSSLARRSVVRRIYLFLTFALGVITLLTSGSYALYLIVRVVLGEVWTTAQTSDVLTAGSAAAIAGLLLAYHLRIFRRDAAMSIVTDAAEPVSGVAFIRAADLDAWHNLVRRLDRPPGGITIDVHQIDAATIESLRIHVVPLDPPVSKPD